MINENQQQHEHSDEAVRAELLKTLEYYFSSKNLSKDDYLVSQMDDECYVSVDEIAKFNKIRTLTNDKHFIRHIIAQSDQLELDAATGNKVRSVNGRLGGSCQPKVAHTASHQRSVLILREVSPLATSEHIQGLFANKEPLCAPCDKCESAGNQSWYVTFTNEDQAQRALQYLKTEVQVFMDRAIKARIKAHAIPRSNTTGFSSLTPTSTPPPQPQPPPPTIYPQLAASAPAYELPVYPQPAAWPLPLQNALFLVDINQPFQEHEHRVDVHSNPNKVNMMLAKQYFNHYTANHHHYMAQQTAGPFYPPLFDDQKATLPQNGTPAPLAYFYNQLGTAPAALHQMQTSSASSSSSSPRLNQQQQFRPRAAEVKVGAPVQTAVKHGKAKPNEPAPVFNSESSFPPLNPACARNITISLRKLNDEGSDMAPIDPAIISCYKSADCIPDSPTIIKSNSVIDSTCHESKKATSETLANILNHEHRPDYKNASHFHHRHKHEAYQPRYRNSRQQHQTAQRKNEQARYVRAAHSSGKSHKEVVVAAEEACAASDDDALADCWAKKLTFAEIVQKSASPSPMSAGDYAESIDAHIHTSSHSIAAE